MHKELIDYIKNTEDDIYNFNLGVWYEKQSHKSPATSFYLRCAEITQDKNLEYECLLRLYLCYKGSDRDYTCEVFLKYALEIDPKKPEAYFFLSQYYEFKKNWFDSYFYAHLGLMVSDKTPSNFKTVIDYESEYMLIFYKAVSAWWIGKNEESRMLFNKLKDEYKLNKFYFMLVEKNILNIGVGNYYTSSIRYNKKYDDLKFKFEDSEKIDKNFSQVLQDLFVLTALNGKKNGTYLEIGSGHSFLNSNTALLEQLGWTGIGVERNPELAEMHRNERKNKILCENSLEINYEEVLKSNFKENIIDYLQLDVEPSINTFMSMCLIPFNDYKFRVITYEHDHYVDMKKIFREKSRNYLRGMGYTLVFNDIAAVQGSSFEDWWVHKDLIDDSIFKNLISCKKEDINLAKDIMLKKK